MLTLTLAKKQQTRISKHLSRQREEISLSSGAYIYKKDREFLSFSTNNYLGLAQHPNVIAACQHAVKKYGVGSGSAYHLSGYHYLHRELEEKLAAFLHYPKVLLFSNGYMANFGTIPALATKDNIIFCDKLNHASLIDGCLASKAKVYRYPHCNLASVERHFQCNQNKQAFVITEGLFGMEGTLAPLPALSAIAKDKQAFFMVDDAHGIGVMGKEGKGSLEHYGLGQNNVPLLMGTLGKAFGSYGAFIASDDLIIESVLQSARTYLYTTALPPALAATALASLQLMQEEAWRRDHLFSLINYLRKGLEQLKLPLSACITPIQPIVIGDNAKTLKIAHILEQHAIDIKAIRPPTVPAGCSRLRISLTANHTQQQLDYLLEVLAHAISKT